MNIQIRNMEVSDCAAVAAIDQAVSTNPWNEKLFTDCVCVGYDCWVMLEQDKIIGFGILSHGALEGHILNLVIDPGYQGRGLGAKMLRYLIDLAIKYAVQEVFLEV